MVLRKLDSHMQNETRSLSLTSNKYQLKTNQWLTCKSQDYETTRRKPRGNHLGHWPGQRLDPQSMGNKIKN
jgi:hypothetical protein